jgi:thioredoxin reductase (NADPH)
MEAQLCESEEVAVVGGGNSAGQAAVFIAKTSLKVNLLVRSAKLSESMSQYLIARIDAHPKIEVHYRTQIIGVTGAAHLESIDWKTDSTGLKETKRIRHVFVMAGASPRTEWLEDSFVLDKKGFIVTGPDLVGYTDHDWPLSRPPLLLETSVPGVFAVGDARAGSIKRVASAVGEGAMAVHLVHRFLAECAEQFSQRSA